jgi:HEPN domain-containing protein
MQGGSAAEYMRLAADDEAAAGILLAGGGSDRVIGFCCQQAVEKMLKAVLIASGIEPPFRHSLLLLTQELEGAGEVLPASFADLVKLDPYEVTHRYVEVPTGHGLDMSDALRMVAEVRRWAEARIL